MENYFFQEAYNRYKFLNFLRKDFLPDDFVQEEEAIEFATKTAYSKSAVKLGVCKSLDLVVYEITHTGKEDPRVGLSKEAFRMLAEEWQDRALVIFVADGKPQNYRFSLIEVKLEGNENSNRIERKYSNPRRYSYLLGEGIGGHTPNEYLFNKGKIRERKEGNKNLSAWEDLLSRFSVEILTKAFYAELSDWYAWAIDTVTFPGEQTIDDKEKRNEHRSKNVIRLLTRLLFVWFLKQKKLIPDEIFDEEYLKNNILKDFAPNLQTGLFKEKSKNSVYYKAILQNLFFATLNCPIVPQSAEDKRERGFRKKDYHGQDYGNLSAMRYESLFSNANEFLKIVNTKVPFLNGGLFDCLDIRDDKENNVKRVDIDGFSDNLPKPNQLIVPDYLFFGEVGKGQDLSNFYGDTKKKNTDVYALLDILKKYNFTIEENTPFDQEVSLDPELLGKVFENLLASYNPETKTTARKQTGSFYTPREIVQYMVDESLVAHLKRTVGDEFEDEYRKLMRYTDEPTTLNDEQKRSIIQSLQNCKVLDPACGSGAFPVGILQQMVHILSQIDPKNETWKDLILENSIRELGTTLKDCTPEERDEIQDDINRNFDDSINRPDYARKLYLIENCIYGVDIQPIAIQISKLRFFISLVVDQKPTTDATTNFGIRPLPNLEAKFVAANTLIGLNKGERKLFDNQKVEKLQEKLIQASHRIFGAKSNKTKNKYKAKVEEFQNEIAEKLLENGDVGNDDARLMRQWRMFDQNSSSPFFDPEWMFGVSGGFDIVIGNPPYVSYYSRQSVALTCYERYYYLNNYDVVLNTRTRYNSFHLFIEKGLKITAKNGILSFIIDKTFLSEKTTINLRKLICDKYRIMELAPNLENVFLATVDPLICIIKNECSEKYFFNVLLNSRLDKGRIDIERIDIENVLNQQGYEIKIESLLSNIDFNKIFKDTSPLKKVVILKSGANVGGHNDEFLFSSKINEKYKPVLRGSNNVLRYKINYQEDSYILYDHSLQYKINSIEESKEEGKVNLVKLGDGHIDKRFEKEKIIIRQSGATFIATYDNEGYYCLYGLFVLNQLDSSVNLKYILALLNSKLYTYYGIINHTIITGFKKQPQIRAKGIKELPIKIIQNQEPFSTIVDKILEAKKTNPTADTSELENYIDFLVYKLYGLTYNEVLIIDPQTPITKPQYENEN